MCSDVDAPSFAMDEIPFFDILAHGKPAAYKELASRLK